MCLLFFFFFFQAEDGIRDLYVTGVQTCALPICRHLVGVVVERAFGERGAQRTQQAFQASTGDGRDNGGGGWWRLVEVGEVGGGRGEVGVGVDRDDRGSGRRVEFRHLRQRGGRLL